MASTTEAISPVKATPCARAPSSLLSEPELDDDPLWVAAAPFAVLVPLPVLEAEESDDAVGATLESAETVLQDPDATLSPVTGM